MSPDTSQFPTVVLGDFFHILTIKIGRRDFFPLEKVKKFLYQLTKAIDHLHRNGIFHRDIKPENILIRDDVLKLADFGSCRNIYTKHPYTEYISTRWYRSPECLLTNGYYSYPMDVWSIGCVFYEILSLRPLFPGANEVDQISKIHDLLGTPPLEILQKVKHRNPHIDFNFPYRQGTGLNVLLPHASPEAIDLLTKMITYDPESRISAKRSLRHPYFQEIRDAEKKAYMKLKQRLENANKENMEGPNHVVASSLAEMNTEKIKHITQKKDIILSNKHEEKSLVPLKDTLKSKPDGILPKLKKSKTSLHLPNSTIVNNSVKTNNSSSKSLLQKDTNISPFLMRKDNLTTLNLSVTNNDNKNDDKISPIVANSGALNKTSPSKYLQKITDKNNNDNFEIIMKKNNKDINVTTSTKDPTKGASSLTVAAIEKQQQESSSNDENTSITEGPLIKRRRRKRHRFLPNGRISMNSNQITGFYPRAQHNANDQPKKSSKVITSENHITTDNQNDVRHLIPTVRFPGIFHTSLSRTTKAQASGDLGSHLMTNTKSNPSDISKFLPTISQINDPTKQNNINPIGKPFKTHEKQMTNRLRGSDYNHPTYRKYPFILNKMIPQ